MKRPFGFDSAIDTANHDDGFANMSISKKLILELDNYICHLEVKCDGITGNEKPRKTVSDAVDYYDGVCPEEVERSKGGGSIDKKGEWYATEVNKLFEAAKRDGVNLIRTDQGTIYEVVKPTISKDEAWDKAVGEDVSPFYIIENYEVK